MKIKKEDRQAIACGIILVIGLTFLMCLESIVYYLIMYVAK